MTPLEHVAKAIWESEYPSIPWEKANERMSRAPYREIARTALLALSALALPEQEISVRERDDGCQWASADDIRKFQTMLVCIANQKSQ